MPILEMRNTWRTSTRPSTCSLRLRREHAGERRLDLVDRLVNDVVVAHLDAGGLGQLARRRVGARVEADDHGARGHRQVDVGLGDAADAGVHHGDLDFVGARGASARAPAPPASPARRP